MVDAHSRENVAASRGSGSWCQYQRCPLQGEGAECVTDSRCAQQGAERLCRAGDEQKLGTGKTC